MNNESNLSEWSLSQWLDRLETLHPQEIELGLDRIRQVYQRLSLPKNSWKGVITVAGTNGKGSTVAILEAILGAAGFRLGCYTSPHLLKYNERIKINGEVSNDAAICDAFHQVERARGDISLTYFEFGTLAALYLFAQAGLDYLLLEVGMGGRLDAVNIVEPDISVITSISLDHQAWLGSDREAIGYEKAGIIRPDKPVICGDPNPPQSLQDRAEQSRAPLLIRGRHYDCVPADKNQGVGFYGIQSGNGVKLTDLKDPGLPLANLATALQTLLALSERGALRVSLEHIKAGLERVKLAGRYQRIAAKLPTILDVAHNPEASAYLAGKLKQEHHSGKIVAVAGMLRDKDSVRIVAPLLRLVDDWLVCDLPAPRAKPAEQLAAELVNAGAAKVDCFSGVAAALDAAYRGYAPEDLVLVFGSFYTVSEAMHYLQNEIQKSRTEIPN